ncbi:MAG: hypothetical protein ILNGONEN_02145 [Syntrophorhabdaceae bacterium]|nr:hypothetical protein [Syntrophorhabdaceae bacterium]
MSPTVSAVNRITNNALDLSDVLRTEIVLAVSALDHFIHEYVRLGMLEICIGNRSITEPYKKFKIPLQAAHSGQTMPTNALWLDEAIREQHSWISFQEPSKIADAIRLISSANLWDEVGKELGKQAKDVKDMLKLIVDRRNKIAHEADMDPTNPGARWPITQSLAEEAINNIEIIVETIYKVTI